MKNRNSYMKIICFVLITAVIITINPVCPKADSSYELLDRWKETMDDEGEEWETDFYIDHFGSLKLVFSDLESYGKFNVRIIDENGDDVLDKTFRFDYEDQVFKVLIPEGTYTIAVTSYEGHSQFYLKAYFKPMSDVTYNQVAKKAKSMAEKYITFDTIDAGNHSRLYGMEFIAADDTHIKSSLYAALLAIQPYIDIQKKDGSVYTKLKIKGKETLITAYYQDTEYDKIIFTSEDYRLVFNIDSSKSSDKYDYSSGIYTIVCKTDTSLSTNDKINEDKLDRLIELLKDKKSRIKFFNSEDDSYFYSYIDDKTCKNWIKMIRNYQKLLVLYN